MSLMEKTDKPEKKEILSDNDSEADDYNLTEDQRRALEELDNLKTEMGYPGIVVNPLPQNNIEESGF